MLRLMRNYATSWLIKILLGAIVIVFVFWGVGSFRERRAGRVALVNGDSISVEAYRNAYNNLIEQYRQRFGNSLNEEMIKLFQINKQALNQLIDQTLLLQEAVRLNFRVSDDELAKAIRDVAAFQRAGVFDSGAYKRVLNLNRLTPEKFERIQRESMLINKLRSFILNGVKVSDGEAQEWFKWNDASVNLDFVLFDPDTYEDVAPTEEEIETYYESHKSSYKTQPQVKVRYLHFDPASYEAGVQIGDGEIRDYYESNREEFRTPKTVEARHILLKVDQNAAAEAVEDAKRKALDIFKMAREGQDFAELAKKYSEGPTKDRGGYLGTFRRESMVKPFADKAFALKAGEIGEPVRTRFGWHIIKVEKVNEESTTSLDEAESKIRRKLTEESAKLLAYDGAEAVNESSFEGDDLVEAAEARGHKVITTDFFTQAGPDKGMKDGAKFASVAFNLPVMEISDIKEFEGGYYILQVVEKMPGKIPELKTVEEKMRSAWMKEKKEEKARQNADEFLKALKDGQDLNTESKKLNLTPGTTGFFKRNAPIPNIGPEREIGEAAFKLFKDNELPDKVLKGSKGYYVVKFRERKKPEPEAFDKEKENVRKKLLEEKKFKTFGAWMSQVRSRSEISIEEGFGE